MKRLLLSVAFLVDLLVSLSLYAAAGPVPSPTEKGTVKGRATDGNGRPITGADVVIENTLLYASYVYATTDANGYYSTQVPKGTLTFLKKAF